MPPPGKTDMRARVRGDVMESVARRVSARRDISDMRSQARVARCSLGLAGSRRTSSNIAEVERTTVPSTSSARTPRTSANTGHQNIGTQHERRHDMRTHPSEQIRMTARTSGAPAASAPLGAL